MCVKCANVLEGFVILSRTWWSQTQAETCGGCQTGWPLRENWRYPLARCHVTDSITAKFILSANTSGHSSTHWIALWKYNMFLTIYKPHKKECSRSMVSAQPNTYKP